MIAQKQQQWQLYSIICVCFIFKEKPFSVRKLKRPTVAAATAAAVVANGEKKSQFDKMEKRQKTREKNFQTLPNTTSANWRHNGDSVCRPASAVCCLLALSLFLFLFHSHFLSFSLFLFKVWRPHKTARLCTGRLAHRFLLERERDKE